MSPSKDISDKTVNEDSATGLVEVYTGNGKGKTSAALGLALRAAGHGFKTHIIFFMKGEFPYGEQSSLTSINGITFEKFGQLDFVDRQDIKPLERQEAQNALEAARRAMDSNKYDILILDEVNVAAAWNLIDTNEVVALIKNKPPRLELILTGRYAPPELIQLADLVTEMQNIKHPYDKGVSSREGIEY